MKYGYIRTSGKSKYKTTYQEEVFLENGLEKKNLITEYFSGRDINRPKLNKIIQRMKPNDELIFLNVGRLSREGKETLEKIINMVNDKGGYINFIEEGYTTKNDDDIQKILDMSENYKDDSYNRSKFTKRGIEMKKKKENLETWGRQPISQEVIQKSWDLHDKGYTMKEITNECGISQKTFYRYLNKRKSEDVE